MKSWQGLKSKASQVVKQQLDQAKERAAQRGGQATGHPGGRTPPVEKPFEPPSGGAGEGQEDAGTPPRSPGTKPARPDGGGASGQATPTRAGQAAGAPEVDPALDALLHAARSDKVRRQFLSLPQTDYTATHSLRLLAGTYNVNGRPPPPGLDLRPWLDAQATHADVVAVAFQEIVPLSAQNVVMGASLEAAGAWDRLIDAALNGSSGDREEGHLVARSQSLDGVSAGSDAGAAPAAAADSPGTPGRATAAAAEDGEEQYLSPRADLASVFSDELPGPSKPYVQVAAKQMVGVYLSVWVRRPLLPRVRGVQATSVGTGIMGYLGNKGAVAVRLRLFDSGLTLIAAHLSSGEAEGDEAKRNYDYAEIVRRGAFPPDAPALDSDSLAAADGKPAAAAGTLPGQWGDARGLLSSEHTVWMGDLNYRLAMPDAEARAAIKAGRLGDLAAADELGNAIRGGRAFQGWREGPLSFPPTFKFRRGTDTYLGDEEGECETEAEQSALSTASTAPSLAGAASPNGQAAKPEGGVEKRRTPAWTDRVLWRPGERLRQLSYGSAPLTVSDHKPVAALFSLVARQYLQDRIEAAIDASRRIVDAEEAAKRPRCELEPASVDAGAVRYAREQASRLLLTNRGRVSADWQFMPLPGAMFGEPADASLRPAPRWAALEPCEGRLEAGQAAEVQLSIRADGGPDSTAALLAAAPQQRLDAILVLRVTDGNDIFCSVTGSFRPSFFGLPLALLAGLPRPLQQPAPSRLGSPQLRVATQRGRGRARADRGSDGPPADFYSPMSSFHDSPASTATADGECAAFRGGRGASGLSVAASDAARSGQASEPASSPPLASPPAHDDADGAAEGDAAESLLPPELVALTDFLRAGGRLKTPGLFVTSVDLAHAAGPRPPGSGADEAAAAPVTAVREALDCGEEIPADASARDVAATLLAFFCALPSPLMPLTAAEVCGFCAPGRDDAAALLDSALAPAELAVFRHTVGLLREALAPENAEENGLTRSALASLFSELWFERAPPGLHAGGQHLRPSDVGELQRLADGVAEVSERRAAFVAAFLEPEEA